MGKKEQVQRKHSAHRAKSEREREVEVSWRGLRVSELLFGATVSLDLNGRRRCFRTFRQAKRTRWWNERGGKGYRVVRGSMTGKNELLATCAYNFVHRLCYTPDRESRITCKKLRFKGPRFTLEKLTLRSYKNRREFIVDEGEGKYAHKRKCSLFIFVSHAERKWSFACFNSISLWGASLWGGTPSRGEGDGFSRPRKRSQFVAATSLQRLLKFSHCYCKTFTI